MDEHARGEGRHPLGRGGVKEFDWEGYLENQAASPPLPSYRANSDDLPSLEATLTRGTSLFDHLEWQLKLGHFSRAGRGGGAADHRQPRPRRLPDQPLEEIAEEAGVPLEFAEAVLKKIRSWTRRAWPRATCRSACCSRRVHVGADDDVVVGIITKHLGNLEKKNYEAIAKDLNQPLEEIYEAAKVIMEFDPQAGARPTPTRSRPTSRPTSSSTRWATSTSWCPTTTACPS